MIDKDLKPWLIEVNTNPCLEESSALLKQLVPRMLDDAFKLTLDVIFPPLKSLVQFSVPAKKADEMSAEKKDAEVSVVVNQAG